MIEKYDGKKKIIIFTGAGISAESGISTFRDADGLWEEYKIEDVCNQDTWKKNFDLVHMFYNQRRIQLKDVQPNKAHQGIAKIQEKYGEDCYIVTQNVDDLFERAGCKDVLHVHGELNKMECTACDHVWEIGYKQFDMLKDRCPICSSLRGVKPYVVFFNAPAPKYRELYRAFDAGVHKESIIVIIGTMGNVVPVNELIRTKACKRILNNLEPSAYIDENIFHKVYYETATTAIEKIDKAIAEYWEL